jgi:hypothetical protein
MVVIWLLNGLQLLQPGAIVGNAPTVWQIQNANAD